MNSPRGPVVAILGNGPRALWALECLDAHLHTAGATPPSAIHVFGAGEFGAGAVYDLAQPEYLRLNVASSSVDAWRGQAKRGPSFDAWRQARAPGSADDPYPPRALTGKYLHEQGQRVRRSLRRTLGRTAVVVHDVRVDQVRQSAEGQSSGGQQWLLDGFGPFDEVLLAVGHSDDWPGALRHDWPDDLPPLQPRVFPVCELLARPELRPGATVVVRGAALTAIDAVLALTLGRGQRPATSDVQIVLTSRTGRPMYPKTEAAVLRSRIDSAGDSTWCTAAVAEGADVLDLLRRLAGQLLGGGDRAAGAVAAAETELFTAPRDGDPVSALRDSIAIASGDREPDGAWGLGQAWRLLYPSLVARQRRTPVDQPTLGWPDFATWARELERLAFGPPLCNAQLLLEGLASGRVEIKRADVKVAAAEADLVVDAVLAPSGIVDLPADGVLGRLRDAGVLSHGGTHRGARVCGDASVLDVKGVRVPGLALVGRATEDVVLGNDTLIRELHPEVDAWACRILALPIKDPAQEPAR